MTLSAARVVFVAAVVVLSVTGSPALADDGAGAELGSETFAQTDIDPDRVVLDLTLEPDGTATWAVSYRVELATDNETAAFEDLQADISENTTVYTEAFRDRMERTARTAENATGRSMAIENLSVSTDVEGVQQYGTVTYRFRWTNFAAVDDETIRAGDALAGFFLETNSRLAITWPDGYSDDTVSPTPDDRHDRTAIWQGPIEFGPDGPQVVASPASAFPTLAVAAVAAILAIGLLGGVLWWRTREHEPESVEETSREDTGASVAGEASEAEPDEELLSNEERVLRLLDERGGRVKQQEVAAEFDWTDAKTSQVVKTLREDGRLEVFRLGRENVLVDPEESEL
ncbi:MAG: helix-turn-helix transcriptional regulator [Halapricum sp.]